MTKTAKTTKTADKTATAGIGKHGHKVGRPRLGTRDAVRNVIRMAKEQGISERAACEAAGMKYITFNVNKKRLGLVKARTAKAVNA